MLTHVNARAAASETCDDRGVAVITVFAAVGAGLVGGLLFAFSNVVMGSLDGESPEIAGRVMNRINVVIVNPLFVLLFAGTAVASAVLVIAELADGSDGSWLRIAGAACYLLGVIGVTAGFHIPRNNRLAAAPVDELGAAWVSFVRPWTVGNHVRAVAAAAAALLLTASLL